MNSPALKMALATLIALLTFASSQANAAATGSISGTMQGEPTGDTCVRDVGVYDPSGDRVAGIDGRSTLWYADDYRIDGLEPGEYRLSFEQSCVDRLGPLPTGGPITYLGEFFNDSPTLEEATPVTVVEGTETTGVDAILGLGNPIEWEDDEKPPATEPEPTASQARINRVKVVGPTRARKGKETTQRVRITNSGDRTAKRVRLKVKGRGISYRAPVGSIPADTTKTIKVNLVPGKSGSSRLKFKVTSSNAGTMSVQRTLVVRPTV